MQLILGAVKLPNATIHRLGLLLAGLGIVLLMASTPAGADEAVDIDFVVEFAGLSDLIMGFETENTKASKPLIAFVNDIQRTNRFSGHAKFARPLMAAARSYAKLAKKAENTFVADPRNADMVELYGNVFAYYAELFPRLAKCAQKGKNKYCLAVFNSMDGQPRFKDASANTVKVANEVDALIEAFKAKYGSFAAARAAQSGAPAVAAKPAKNSSSRPRVSIRVMFDIEAMLSILGYDPGPVDGIINAASNKALNDLIAHSEGVFPKSDPKALLEAIQTVASDARNYPQDRDWGKDKALNRQLAKATGYLGGFSGEGFENWVKRQPDSAVLARDVRKIRAADFELFRLSLAPPNVSKAQLSLSVTLPIAPVNKCDRLAAVPGAAPVKGVQFTGAAFDQIELPTAITACETALKSAPSEARFAFQLARARLAANQPAKAKPVFQALAKLGHIPSIGYLGEMEYRGLGGKKDLRLARKYLSVAAPTSDRALRLLVGMLRRGEGGPKAPAEAARWLKSGITHNGKPDMILTLANMIAQGEGVAKDPARAAALRRRASGDPAIKKAAAPEPADGYIAPPPTVLVLNSVIEPGHAPELSYAGLPATGQNWLAVSTPDMAGKAYYFLKMLDPGSTEGAITGPKLPAGRYQARLFLNWPEGGYDIVDRAPIEVVHNANGTIRQRQIMVELATLLEGQDVPQLAAKLSAAREGGPDEVRVLAEALIARATEYSAAAAEMGDPRPYAAGLVLGRYALELMPKDGVIARSVAVFYLMAPIETGLNFEAARLLENASHLAPADRLTHRLWIEALMSLGRYDAATSELGVMWPPRDSEVRLIGLASDLYLAANRPKDGLALLSKGIPVQLGDATNLARIALSLKAGQTEKMRGYITALSKAANPYFAAIGKNMAGRFAAQPDAPIKPQE